MSIIRGYSNYRGRSPKGSRFLAALLVLVILAALSVLLLQRYVVYDEAGRPALELPWEQTQEEKPEDLPPLEDFELVIQTPEEEDAVPGEADWTVRELPAMLTRSVWRQAQAEEGLDSVVVTLKDAAGTVYFESAAALPEAVVLPEGGDALTEITESALHTVARITCFSDPKAAGYAGADRALKDTDGYVFYDGNNRPWMDPGKPAARSYLCAVAAEAAALGFDEVLLSDIGYPTLGKLEQIAYAPGDRAAHIAAFLQEMRQALEPYDILLCVELPESVLLSGSDAASALVLSEIAPQVDGIYTRAPEAQRESIAAAVASAAPELSLVLLPAGEAEAAA
ncbi:MAG: hypothetical protein E7429_00565 [Ruminococcaceae bacterium]|nr:hypothetical protein [Oscillospiraceae bacterium]